MDFPRENDKKKDKKKQKKRELPFSTYPHVAFVLSMLFFCCLLQSSFLSFLLFPFLLLFAVSFLGSSFTMPPTVASFAGRLSIPAPACCCAPQTWLDEWAVLTPDMWYQQIALHPLVLSSFFLFFISFSPCSSNPHCLGCLSFAAHLLVQPLLAEYEVLINGLQLLAVLAWYLLSVVFWYDTRCCAITQGAGRPCLKRTRDACTECVRCEICRSVLAVSPGLGCITGGVSTVFSTIFYSTLYSALCCTMTTTHCWDKLTKTALTYSDQQIATAGTWHMLWTRCQDHSGGISYRVWHNMSRGLLLCVPILAKMRPK